MDQNNLIRRRGFTLTEIVVVILIIGVLASFAVLQYTKVGEQAKLDSAQSTVEAVAAANRLRAVDTAAFVTGNVSGANILFTNSYLKSFDVDTAAYSFSGADDPVTPCVIASAARKTTGPQGNSNPKYATWGACANVVGQTAQYTDGQCPLTCEPAATASAPPGGPITAATPPPPPPGPQTPPPPTPLTPQGPNGPGAPLLPPAPPPFHSPPPPPPSSPPAPPPPPPPPPPQPCGGYMARCGAVICCATTQGGIVLSCQGGFANGSFCMMSCAQLGDTSCTWR